MRGQPQKIKLTSTVSSRSKNLPTQPTGRSWWGKTNMTLVGLGVIALLIALIVTATLDTGMYYLTVDEYHSRLDNLRTDKVRINGEVVADSEVWNAQATTLEFKIQDPGGQHSLQVVYVGPRPDNFHRATSAILEGSMSEDGTFHASSLLTKCPSRYEEESPLVEAAS